MQPFKQGKVTANGLEFTFLEQGEGPLVLCMHGFPDTARSFRHQLPALAQAGYRAVAPFMRGYAPTAAAANGNYQTAALGQDVLALIEALGAQQAVVIGHDWGSTAASAAALFAPEKVSKLITLALPYGGMGTALLNNWAQQKRSWYIFFFQTALADLAVPLEDFAFIERLWRDWSPGWDFPAEEMRALKQTLAQPGVLAAALGYYRCTMNPERHDPLLAPLQARIGREPIQVPTLNIHGALDGCIGAEFSQNIDALFPAGLTNRVIADGGHFLHQEQPEQVNRLILDFLQGT
ncbi:MAG TPA: alpha/beta hydrolase [Pseudomonadales bacterium]|jgi:pimeloyl-ACP methyl ester carboxylesterase|nr:alpha/beta hydrolase [Pseudomonadales bacterium]HMW14588.1 alpha/beta hydrolase [Pseudomonadales bacterium]HMW82373.1 alpha/beta hydrolase [Pseudomonadales bacterium]HMY95949.1 alpha/beta hydrolase [Pseudomonadales bacterium]HMZ70148.1 alpha/beta hydrolase [Pseudomonadales bacterium]